MPAWPFHPSAWPQKDKREKDACMFLKTESFSCASVNTPLHGTLHLFCKVYIDPTHREMTPLSSRRACQSARRLFTYNMFHIFIANTTSGVLVSSCIKLMLHFHERLNMKRKARIYYPSTGAGVVGRWLQEQAGVCGAWGKTHTFLSNVLSLKSKLRTLPLQSVLCPESVQVSGRMITGTFKGCQHLSHQFRLLQNDPGHIPPLLRNYCRTFQLPWLWASQAT